MKDLRRPPYPNLAAERGKLSLSIARISRDTGIKYNTLRDKFSGKSDWLRPEMINVRDRYWPGLTLDYLFAREADNG